jgi:hypothetical protein
MVANLIHVILLAVILNFSLTTSSVAADITSEGSYKKTSLYNLTFFIDYTTTMTGYGTTYKREIVIKSLEFALAEKTDKKISIQLKKDKIVEGGSFKDINKGVTVNFETTKLGIIKMFLPSPPPPGAAQSNTDILITGKQAETIKSLLKNK